MTVLGHANGDEQTGHDDKPQRGFEDQEIPAVVVAVVVGIVPILLAVVTYYLASPAVWAMGIGAGLIAVGLWGGIRGAVGCGVLGLAIGGMIMSSDSTFGAALFTNALVITMCLLVLVGTDLSFTMRRGSDVASETVQGYLVVHAVALGVGVLASVLVGAGVEAVNWPSWLIVVPIAGLTATALWVARWTRSYRTEVRRTDAPVVGQGPAPQNPDPSWRDFRWQSPQNES